MAAVPLSFVIGSPIAGWILGHSWSGMPGWRWLFVVEGVPAIVLGIVAYFFLTDSPDEAQWLKAEQRDWIARTLEKQKPQGESSATVWDAFRSRRAVLLAGIAFLNYSVFYSFIFWMPTILKRFSGLADARVGLLGAIPYLVCFIVMPINGWHSDKQLERRWHIAIPMLIAAAGLFGLMGQSFSMWTLVGQLTLVTAGNAYLSVFWSLPTEILSPSIAAASVGLISSVGSFAGFGSPYMFGYLREKTGTFTVGLAILGTVTLAMAWAIFLVPRARESKSAH